MTVRDDESFLDIYGIMDGAFMKVLCVLLWKVLCVHVILVNGRTWCTSVQVVGIVSHSCSHGLVLL